MSRLVVEQITKRFGAFAALDNVSVVVGSGERRAVIGPNGAGKTTLFAVIGGQLAPDAGRIILDGTNLVLSPPHRRAGLGLGRTFQRNNLFLSLSALENVRLAVQARANVGHRFLRSVDHHCALTDRAAQTLTRVGLEENSRHRADELSYGDQRRLELAIALAGEPDLLLVDEPTAGMSAAESSRMVELLQELPRTMSLLIVEHDMDVIASVTDQVTVLHHGRVLAEGPWKIIRDDANVQEAYLGTRVDGARRASRA